MKTPIVEYQNRMGAFPVMNDLSSAKTSGKYVSGIAAANTATAGVYTATFKGQSISEKLRNRTLTMTFTTANDGTFTFTCPATGGAWDGGITPNVCQ